MSFQVVGDGPDLDALSDAFDRHLSLDRGASEATRDVYGRHVRAFLISRASGGEVVDLQSLSAPEVRDYVTGIAGRYARQSVKLIASAIRCFLRFAWIGGYTVSDLSGAVGVVIVHRFGHVPKSLGAEDLRRLLAVPDRSTRSGARDYAVLVLLSRLGLRAGEVARLRLEDFDWRTGQVVVSTKGDSRLRLPVPWDVGEAIVGHLRLRSESEHRELFLRVKGPASPLTRGAVTQIVGRCADKAGLGVVHAHRLRHTAARRVLEAGGGLDEVGQLLGHSTPQVTMMYASLDVVALQPLAREWPEGASHA